MKALKIIGRISAGILLLAGLAFVGLLIYAKYFYSSEIKIETHYMAELPIPTDRFGEDFADICKTVKENYSLYESKNIDIDALSASFAERIKGMSTGEEYGMMLGEYFAALNVGHSYVYFNDYAVNASIVCINDSIFLDKPDIYLQRSGFQDKDQIIAVDGIPVNSWMEQNGKYISASTPEYKRLFTARSIFRSYTDTDKQYTVCRGSDTLDLHLVLMPQEKRRASERRKTSWEILNDSTGYLQINTMMNGIMEEFTADYQQVKHLPNLIIDVRSNGGGNSGNGRDLCRYLIREEQPHCLDAEPMIPMEEAFKGKILLLTSTFTYSAAESFVLDMKESGNALLIGEPTAGDTGNRPQTFKSAFGICFRIPTNPPALSPKGFPMEGKGIAPDHIVKQTVSDFMNNRDTQLEYALQCL